MSLRITSLRKKKKKNYICFICFKHISILSLTHANQNKFFIIFIFTLNLILKSTFIQQKYATDNRDTHFPRLVSKRDFCCGYIVHFENDK